MADSPWARIRLAFDIYSPNPFVRAWVLALMAAGGYLLLRPVEDGAILGALPFLVLLVANRERFGSTLEGLLRARPGLVLVIPLLALAGPMLLDPPTAPDDLLRHIASVFWPDGYEGMYVHSRLPAVELYPTFDWFVGALAKRLGPAPAMWVTQAIAFAGFVAVFALASRRFLAGHPDAMPVTTVALVLVLSCVAERLVFARPEVFLAIWALSAAVVQGRAGVALWALTGLVLGTGYWLTPIYFPAVLLLPLSTRARWTVLLSLIAAWGACWWWMTDGAFIAAFASVLLQTVKRVPGISVRENASVLGLLQMPQMLLLVFASAWAVRKPGVDNRLLMLSGYFALSNQVRYVDLIAPLLAFHVLSGLRGAWSRWPKAGNLAVIAVSAACMAGIAAGMPRYANLPLFKLPSGAVVLTTFSEATFSTPFANPGTVRVAPGFDIGALDPRVQSLIVGIDRGMLDCDAVRSFGFTHVIEATFQGSPPECFELDRVWKAWRLWSVR